MSVTVFSWNYHIKKNLDYFYNNKTPGDCSLEITGNYKEIFTIKENFLNTFSDYVKSKKIYENYIYKEQNIDKYISENLSEDEKINYRILDLKECAQLYCDNPDNGLIEASSKSITSETLLAYITIKKYNKIIKEKIIIYSSNFGNKEVWHMYFSLSPTYESEMKKNQLNIHSPGNNILSKFLNYVERSETVYFEPIFDSFYNDSKNYANNVDIEKIFQDINPNNLREIYCFGNKFNSKDDVAKRRTEGVRHFEVINGKLSGVVITSKSINCYRSFFHFLLKIKHKNFRKTLFNYYNDGKEINKDVFSKFLKNNVNHATSLKVDISKFLKKLANELILCSDPNKQQILQQKVLHINKLLENLKNVEAKLQIFNDFSGIPPSEIVTLPSKMCDGYGANENIIVSQWMTTVVNTGFDLITTNCAWSIKSILLPAVKEYYSESNRFRLYPWLPKEVLKISREILRNILKKHNNFIFISSYRSPKKKLLTKQQFLDSCIKNCLSLNIKNHLNMIPDCFHKIFELLSKYQYLGDFYLLQRLIIIEQIKEIISKYFDENYKTSITKEKKEFSILRSLYQILLDEEQEIILFIISNNKLK